MILKIKLSLNETENVDINRKLTYHYLYYYTRKTFPENLNDRLTDAIILFDLYNESNIVDANQQPFNSYIFLFVISIFSDTDLYQNTDDPILSTFIFNAIVFLECYQKKNSTDFYSKFLLVCLYNSIGAALTSQFLFESLEIKLIQNDTLGYYFLPAFLHCSLYTQAESFLNLSKFYNYNFNEVKLLFHFRKLF